MKPGNYKAKIVDYAITETKAGLAQVSVRFEFDGTSQMAWYGSLKEGRAQEITIEALRECGFSGETNEDFAKIGLGPKGGALDTAREIDITLDNQIAPDGATALKITRVGGSGFRALDIETVKAKLPNLAESLFKIKAKKKESVSDEIPF